MNGFTSLTNLRVRIRVLKSCPAWPSHEAAWAERFVFAIIKIHLPSAQPAARIDNFPAGAAKHLPYAWSGRLNDCAVAQAVPSGARGGGEPRNQRRSPASCDVPGEAIGIAAAVTKVIAAIDRLAQPAEAFFSHQNKKVARIFSSTQSRPRHRCRIEAALERKTGFHRRVVKRADDEVFAVMPLRTPREFFIFLSKTPHDFGPWNVGSNIGQDRQRTRERDATRNQSPKTGSIGPPINISMGRRFHSYS